MRLPSIVFANPPPASTPPFENIPVIPLAILGKILYTPVICFSIPVLNSINPPIANLKNVPRIDCHDENVSVTEPVMSSSTPKNDCLSGSNENDVIASAMPPTSLRSHVTGFNINATVDPTAPSNLPIIPNTGNTADSPSPNASINGSNEVINSPFNLDIATPNFSCVSSLLAAIIADFESAKSILDIEPKCLSSSAC